MTTLTGTVRDPSGTAVAAVPVVAQLVGANPFTADHATQVIRTAGTVTDSLGAWSLTLTPTGSLAAADARYLVTVDGRRHYVAIPASGTVTLYDALTDPPPAGTSSSGSSSSGTPSGPAGGDLTGTYPNPTIAAGKVTTAKLADAAVTPAKLSAPYEAAGTAAAGDTAHTGAGDPHPQYLTAAEGSAAYAALAHAGTHASAGADPVTPAAIGAAATAHAHPGTYEPSGTVATHEAAGDPHPVYLTSAEGGAAYSPLGHTHTPYAPRLVTARVTSGTSGGDTPADTSGAWTKYTPLGELVITAAVGDYLEVTMSLLTNRSDTGLLLDLGVYVSGSAVWYSSSETATPATEGDPALYPTLSPRSWYAGLVVGSGHRDAGAVHFALAVKGNGTGKLYYSTAYPFRWRVINYGPPG